MITFKQKGKFEYQILSCTKKPLYISLLPKNTISKRFDSVISSLQAMSEILGKVFDDHIFNFVNGYQKCDTEDDKYAFLNQNVKATLQFSTVFVSVNNIDYAGFADETQKTNDSIFFCSKDIIKIIKLSQAMKIYSIVLNTEAGICHEKKQNLYYQFLTLLKADYLPPKLLKFLKILSINAKKNKIRDYSEKKVDDDEDNIDSLVLETFKFILYEGLIRHDYKRNPIPFFAGIFYTNIKYGGKYQKDFAFDLNDDEVETIEDKISRRESREKIIADNFTLNRLYDISLFYLSNTYEGHLKAETSNVNYSKFLEKIEYTSPFWDAILAPLLSKSTGIRYEKLREIYPQQAAAISFYSGMKLNLIFNPKYQNLFGLAFLFPINPPKFHNYRLKNVSQFINATLQFPIKVLPCMGGSRIHIVRLIEDFIGKIKSTPFCSNNTGDLIKNIQTDKIETETIDYIVRYVTNGFEQELKEFETAIWNDFRNEIIIKNIKRQKRSLRKIVRHKKDPFPDKNSRVSNSDHNESRILTESKIDEEYYIKTNEFGRTYKYHKKSNLTNSTSISKNITSVDEEFTAYRLILKNGKIIKEDIVEKN